MWIEGAFYKYAVGVIFVLLIIYLLYSMAPVFELIVWFAAAILLPILIATFLYYVLRPAVEFLCRWGIPRYLAILLVYSMIALSVMLVILFAGPTLGQEISDMATISPEGMEHLKTDIGAFLQSIKNEFPPSELPSIEGIMVSYIQKLNAFLSKLIVNTISTLASLAIALAITPFVVYYFLRDASLFSRFIMRFTALDYQEEVQKILSDIDLTLSNFIQAQMIVALVIGIFLFFGYLLIGLPHALPLALFAMIFYVIPILGTFIAIIPAFIVGMTINFFMAIKVALVMLAAHFLETNLLTPRLMSKMLKIHPLTVIFLLLIAGSLYGLLGLLLVTPSYAIAKVIVWNLYKISRLRYQEAKAAAREEKDEEKQAISGQ